MTGAQHEILIPNEASTLWCGECDDLGMGLAVHREFNFFLQRVHVTRGPAPHVAKHPSFGGTGRPPKTSFHVELVQLSASQLAGIRTIGHVPVGRRFASMYLRFAGGRRGAEEYVGLGTSSE